jgi:hypothetical protein
LAQANIIIANEYTKLPSYAKGWCVPPKPQKPGHKRQVKGPVTIRRNDRSLVTYDSPDDMLKAMRKEAKAAEVRYPDQESFENSEKQIGKGIWSHQLVKQVLTLNPNLFVEDSILVPGCAAFYKVRDGKKTPTGASFCKGLIPEFTIFKKNTEFDSTAITYGWRTVVMRLVKSLDLRYSDVLRIWGEVHFGDSRGKHWNMNIRPYRA